MQRLYKMGPSTRNVSPIRRRMPHTVGHPGVQPFQSYEPTAISLRIGAGNGGMHWVQEKGRVTARMPGM